MLAAPTMSPVSVSVSFSPVHGRSAGATRRARRTNQTPLNAGERPRTPATTPPPHLESVRRGGSDVAVNY